MDLFMIYAIAEARDLGTGTGLEVHEGMRAANTINKHKFLCAAVSFEGVSLVIGWN